MQVISPAAESSVERRDQTRHHRRSEQISENKGTKIEISLCICVYLCVCMYLYLFLCYKEVCAAVYSQRTLQSAGWRPAGSHSGAEGGQTQGQLGQTWRCRWPPPRPYAAPPEEGDAYEESPLQNSEHQSSEQRGLSREKSHFKNLQSHFSVLSSSMRRCKTNYQGECDESVLPLRRLWTDEWVISQVGSDTDDVSSCTGRTFLCSDETGPACSRWGEFSCFSKRWALSSFLPVEKKMTDSLCNAWMNGWPPPILCSSSSSSYSSSLLLAPVSIFSSQWDLV